MEIVKNICYGTRNERDHLMDIYLPEKREGFATFVYFHGGGITGGCKDGKYAFVQTLVDAGYAVVQANYRLYFAASYPDFIDDAARCVDYVINHIEEYGGDKEKIVVGGSSAGGYISMMLAFDSFFLNRYGKSPNNIAGWVFDAGQPTTHFNVLKERGIDSRAVIIDRAAPIFHIRQYSGLKPMIVFAADNDMPGRLEQTHLMLHTLKHFGYPEENIKFEFMEGFTHCKYTGQQIFADKVLAFLKEKIK